MARTWLDGWIVAFAAATMACGSPEDGSTESVDNLLQPDTERDVVLGTGEAAFEPIEGEPHLRLVAGVQGGFHVWASFLAHGFTSDRVDMLLETVVEDDPNQRLVMRARISLRDALDAEDEAMRSFAGFPAQVYDARCAQGKRVRVAVTLSDADGGSATDERYCIAEVDEAQRRADCQ
ncbi:MAG TPA: hypothetical protein VMG12_29285 [Polyangiaceae bacterium]|nr:hypothetical protein [Polyangiaceae bacterium]